MPSATIDQLREVYAELVEMHGWGGHLTPRNMTLALTGRVGAIATQLQFATDESPEPELAGPELRGELADTLVYLLGLSQALGIDLVDEAVNRVSAAVASGRDAARSQ